MRAFLGGLILMVIAIFCVTPQMAYSAEAYDFRKVRWGMTPDEVRKSEDLALAAAHQDFLEYRGSILGEMCTVRYHFTNGHLLRIQAFFSLHNRGMADAFFSAFAASLARTHKKDQTMDDAMSQVMQMFFNERSAVQMTKVYKEGFLVVVEHMEIQQHAREREKRERER